jgi:hypothetical protein
MLINNTMSFGKTNTAKSVMNAKNPINTESKKTTKYRDKCSKLDIYPSFL